MAELDTAAPGPMVQSWCGHAEGECDWDETCDVCILREQYRALAQRLADAERECEIGRRRNTTMEDTIANQRRAVTALRQQRDAAKAQRDRAEAKVADVTEKWAHMSNRYMKVYKVYIEKERAEDVLRHIATWQPDGLSDAELVTLFRDQAGAALAPTEEPHNPWGGSYTKQRSSPTEEPEP